MPTEIERLERRWQENPMGLTFAPLAEAYRKNGALAKALELLDAGLAQHPGYIPAHIVRGRCHLDAGEPALAELDFLCVTELDPENAIALKALADLAEDEGRTGDAIQRLESLLEIDRDNEEAETQLDRLRGEPDSSVSGFAPRDDSAELVPSEQRLEGIVVSDIELHLPRPEQAQRPEPGAPIAAGSLAELPDALTEWLSAPSELTPLPAAEAPVEAMAAPPPETPLYQPEQQSEESEPGPPESRPEQPESELEPVEESVTEAEPDLMVTETMAEIFLRQGHRELALAVYSQLLQREPENERVKAAAEQLAQSLKPLVEPVGEATAEPPRRYDAVSTGGRPVKEYLGGLFSTGRPRPAPAVHPPAFDRDGKKAPSFDEFFAADEPQAPASTAAQEEPLSEETRRGGDAEELEQFHAWLRGLKS